MRWILTKILVLAVFQLFAQESPLNWVDPMIGTGGHGHTFPGATLPFGMVQLSPDTRIDGSWDGCSGYHYSDSLIYGFSHTHLSGTGVSDYGDILVMPYGGKPTLDNKVYGSIFSHQKEKAEAGYYSVQLEDNIQAELTATRRCGIHRYTFNGDRQKNIVIDLLHRDELLDGEIKITGKNRLEGYRISTAWARKQHVYFVMEFSRDFKKTTSSTFSEKLSGKQKKRIVQQNLLFDLKKGESVVVKVGISFSSISGAKKNLEEEASSFDFDAYRTNASNEWEKELNKIRVKGSSEKNKRIFYSALYHTMIHPNIASDVDGTYRGRDNKLHKADHDYYTVFSLWDTFRAAHPLYTLIDRKRILDFIRTFLLQYEQGGRLPVWELAANETDCMIGYHSVSVITDAYVKGIKDFDASLALRAMVASAEWDHLGLPEYREKGFLSMDDEHESVSKTLEYAYDDWCIYLLANRLGENEISQRFYQRSQGWKNILDPELKFMRPRKNGGWLEPFDPREVNNNFTEANSWQYSFFVPHAIPELIAAMGGKKAFEKHLDSLFIADSKTTGREQADITGLIGQYAHGNEPSHHMAYLYNPINRPQKTQQLVRRIMNDLYTDQPDGLSGNEDCGQMSAWYVMSAIGLYSITPGLPVYALGSPLFSEAEIHFEDGKVLTIVAEGQQENIVFVSGNRLPGGEENQLFVSHNEIIGGGKLQFTMSTEPGMKVLLPALEDRTSLSLKGNAIIPVPVISSSSHSFKDSLLIEIRSLVPGVDLYYTLSGKDEMSKTEQKYTEPFYIHSSSTVSALARSTEEKYSHVAVGTFFKRENDWKINISSVANPQYFAGGPEGLLDGITGTQNWRKGDWHGYQSQDFECIIDMNEVQVVNKIAARFLEDTRAWIWFPSRVDFYTSADGVNWKPFGEYHNTKASEAFNEDIKEISFDNSVLSTKARYVKVIARNFGKIPSWHPGSGGDAFIFIDEISIH